MPIFDDEQPASGGIIFDDEPPAGGIVFDDEPSVISRLGEAVPLIPKLAEAYAQKQERLAPYVPYVQKAQEEERKRLAADKGLIGGIELAKGGLYDRTLDLASRAIGAVLPGPTVGSEVLSSMTPEEAYKLKMSMLRTETLPRQIEEQTEKAREVAQQKEDRNRAIVKASLTGRVNPEESLDLSMGRATPEVEAKLADSQTRVSIGELAEDVNPIRAIAGALTAAGHATERLITGGKGFAKVTDEAVEKAHRNPVELTRAEAFYAGLPTLGRVLFGQDGEDAGKVGTVILASVITDPVTYAGGPGLTAAGKAAQSIKWSRLATAAKVGVDLTKDVERATAIAAKLKAPVDLAETMAEQVAARQRTIGTLFGVPVERLGLRVPSEAVHETLGMMGDAIRDVVGPEMSRKLAYSYRFTSLLSPQEQDRLMMDYMKSKQTKYVAEKINQRFQADGEGLKAARARFDRATGNAEADQTRALLKVFEEGAGDELKPRIYQGIRDREISRDEGAYLLRTRKRMNELLATERAAGVFGIKDGSKGLIEALDESEITYLHHAQTQAWRDAVLKVMPRKTPSEANDFLMESLKAQLLPGHGRERVWDMSTRAANAKARELLAAEAAERGVAIDLSGVNLFHEDINVIMAARSLSSVRAVHPAELIEGYGKMFSVPAATLGKDFSTMSVAQLRAFGKAKLEFAEAYRDVWKNIEADPVRFAGAVKDEREARRLLATTRRASDMALAKAKNLEDFEDLHEKILMFPGEQFERFRALTKAAEAAEGTAEAATRAERVFAEVAPLAGEAPGATRALAVARAQFGGKGTPRPLEHSLERLRGATDDMVKLQAAKSDWVVFGEDAPKGLKGRALPPDVAKVVTDFARASREKPNALLHAYDLYQKWWKAWTLGPRPSFHTRNWFSGKFNTWLEDAIDPRAEYLSKLYHSPLDSSKTTFVLNGERVLLHDEAETWKRLGGAGASPMRNIEEMADGLTAKLDGSDTWRALARGQAQGVPKGALGRFAGVLQAYVPWTTATTGKSMALRAGAFTGDLVEGDLRFSHYLGRRFRGDSPIDAIMSSKRAHLDYSEMTPDERAGLGRVFSFYQYLRGNGTLQFGTMFTKPRKIAIKEHTLDALTGRQQDDSLGESGIPIDLFPKYMRDAGFARVGKLVNGRVHMYSRAGYDPAWDMNRFGDIDEGFTSSLATPLQLLLGQVTGRNLFTKRSLTGMDSTAPGVSGPDREMFGSLVHPRLAFTIEKLLPASALELDRLGIVGGKASQPLYGIKGEPPSVGLIPLAPRADEPDRPQPPVRERIVRFLVGLRPYEVELWKEGRRRVMDDIRASKESLAKAKSATSEIKRKDMIEQAVQLRKRAVDTHDRYVAHGIKLQSPDLPIEGYE